MAQHLLPPAQCSTNTVVFTDPTLTAGSIKVRNNHIEELRAQVVAECTRRGLSAPPAWTDTTLTAGSVKIRNDHVTELRTQMEQIRSGRGESGYCPENTVGAFSWTDTLTAGSVKSRNDHIEELRVAINALKSACICETEQCQYCADCGYYYQTCSHAGVACDNHKYSECQYSLTDHRLCASINVGGTHPYKAASGDPLVTTAWDGYVPWDWCSYTPPGSNWSSYWTCKCNPFTW